MQNMELRFRNGNFRIMQIADTQEQYGISPNTLRLIETAVENCRPDLVVLTGDQFQGYNPIFRGNGGRKRLQKAILTLLRPMEERNIPVAVTFGNHDNQCGISNSEQFEMYCKSSVLIHSDPASKGDEGTYCLSIEDKALVYLFDTHSKGANSTHGAVTEDQLCWYRKTRDSFEEKTGSVLPSVAFQHIPAPEYFDVIKKSKRFDSGSVRAYGSHKNEWFTLDPYNKGLRDFMRESPATASVNNGEIDAFLEKKDVKAVFAGHDHNNSFVSKYKDIYLGYTQGCGFNVYGPGLDRGVRCIDLKQDGSFDTRTYTYRELCGTKINRKIAFAFFEVMPSSMDGFKTGLRETGLVLGAAGAVIGGVKYIKDRKK